MDYNWLPTHIRVTTQRPTLAYIPWIHINLKRGVTRVRLAGPPQTTIIGVELLFEDESIERVPAHRPKLMDGEFPTFEVDIEVV